jgi:hypothetical protein
MSTPHSLTTQRNIATASRRASGPTTSSANAGSNGSSTVHASHTNLDEEEGDLDDGDELMPPVDERLSIAPGIQEFEGDGVSIENTTRFRWGRYLLMLGDASLKHFAHFREQQVRQYTDLGSTLCRKFETFGNAINTIKAGYFLVKYEELDSDLQDANL